jgi:hypothetical protein
MATVYHRYLRRGESAPAPGREDAEALKAKKAAADLEFVEEKKRQVVARRMETEIRNLRSKRELIPKTLVQKQAAFLVLSLRARLLAIPAQHADELLGISNRHEMTRRLDSDHTLDARDVGRNAAKGDRRALDAEARRCRAASEAQDRKIALAARPVARHAAGETVFWLIDRCNPVAVPLFSLSC